MIDFRVERMEAWSSNPAFQSRVLTKGETRFVLSCSAQYDVKKMAKRELRRMSLLSRSVVDMSLELTGSQAVDHIVFSTRFGELQNVMSLLESLKLKEELSPTQFSQSVHSTSSGLFSIVSGLKAASSVVSAAESTFSMGLLSALSYANCNLNERVLFVYADQAIPESLAAIAPAASTHSSVIGMILTCGKKLDTQFSLEQVEVKEQTGSGLSSSDYFLQQFFINNKKEITLTGKGHDWKMAFR